MLVKASVDDLRIVAAARKLTLNANVPTTPTIIACHRPSIERLLANLTENAINYSEAGGSVNLHVTTQADDVVLRVEDEGMGIDPAHLPHIFEPFYRADAARNTRTGGNGLGLTSVKHIVDDHNGRIDVQSTLGEWTTFIVTFPAATP